MNAKILIVLMLASSWSTASSASAQVPVSQQERAAAHFDRGLTLVNDGDLSGGLAEFDRAYALSPLPLVLYNLGLVHAALHRSVDAAHALRTVLAHPDGLRPDQLDRARAILQESELRIGRVRISCNVHEGTVEVDNVEVARLPLSGALEVAVGPHVIGMITAGHAPARREVMVPSGLEVAVQLALIPIDGRLAHVRVHSTVPGAAVFVDGERVGVTPLQASVTVVPGTRNVELRRPGYMPVAQQLALQDGALGELTLQPRIDPSALPGEGGVFALWASEGQAQLSVDEQLVGLLAAPLRLPYGPHRLLIERAGFLPAQRDVELSRGGTTRVRVTLEPTPELRASYAERARKRRLTSWLTVAAGAATLASGAVMAVHAQNRLTPARARLTTTKDEWTDGAGGPCDFTRQVLDEEGCRQRLNQTTNDVDNLKTLRTVGWGVAGTGAAVLVTGVLLLVTAPDLHRYDRRPSTNWVVSPTASVQQLGLQASTSF